jgi:hypothetical protein
MSSSLELFEVDTEHCGWTELTLTPTKMIAQWHFVDFTLDKDFSVTSALPITCEVEKRQFS